MNTKTKVKTYHNESSNKLSKNTNSDLSGTIGASEDNVCLRTDKEVNLCGGIDEDTSDALDNGSDGINGDISSDKAPYKDTQYKPNNAKKIGYSLS